MRNRVSVCGLVKALTVVLLIVVFSLAAVRFVPVLTAMVDRGSAHAMTDSVRGGSR